MLRIVKGGIVKKVSRSAFEDYFKPQGWEIEGEVNSSPTPVKKEVKNDKTEKVEEPVEKNSDEEVSDEDWDEAMDELVDEEIEKPISEMNKEELIAKAKSLGINTTGLSNKQLREAIKSSK